MRRLPAGECEKNPVFMVGTKQRPGHCIKACGKCSHFYTAVDEEA